MEAGCPHVRQRVRIDFTHLLQLAHANRPVRRVVAAGSVPPELQRLWDRMRTEGVEVPNIIYEVVPSMKPTVSEF